jgi:hypothetical protein
MLKFEGVSGLKLAAALSASSFCCRLESFYLSQCNDASYPLVQRLLRLVMYFKFRQNYTYLLTFPQIFAKNLSPFSIFT